MKNVSKIVVSFALVGVVAGVSYAAGAAAAKTNSVITPAADLKWEDYAPGSPLKVAKLWGDRTKGAYGMFLKMPAGGEAPIHMHTADYYATNVQGTWSHWVDGGEKKELPVGSYVMQTGKEMHGDACKAGGQDCILFIVQNAAGDFVPKEMPKDAKAKEPAKTK